MKAAIEVVGAIIRQESRLLIAQRPPGKQEALYWEFPGGKVEFGETPEESLRREIAEELGVSIQVGTFFGEVLHDYGGRLIHLSCYWAEVESGEPVPLQCHDVRWIHPPQLNEADFAPADRPIVEKLRRYFAETLDVATDRG